MAIEPDATDAIVREVSYAFDHYNDISERIVVTSQLDETEETLNTLEESYFIMEFFKENGEVDRQFKVKLKVQEIL